MSLRTKLLAASLMMMCVFVIFLRITFLLRASIDSNHVLPPEFFPALIWTISMFAIITVVLVTFVSWAIVRPVQAMQKHAQHVVKGNLDVRIPIKGRDELATLAQTLNYLSDQLSKQESLRKNLMQDIAHELRTPLSTLKSHMEAFIDGVWEPSPERLHSCIDEIERFQTLIGRVETLHEADTSLHGPTSKLDLRHVARTVVELVEHRCETANIELSFQEDEHPVWVLANLDHISQITWNLLDNAMKYTPSGGTVCVSVECDELTSVLRVSDTGIGIPDHEIDNIFERFYRVDRSRSRSSGGSGLGLAIVKQLVNVSQGNISIASEEGVGTTVCVRWNKPDSRMETTQR